MLVWIISDLSGIFLGNKIIGKDFLRVGFIGQLSDLAASFINHVLKWDRLLGNQKSAEQDEKIKELTAQLENELHPKWDAWRKKHYVISEAQKELEKVLSLPGM